MKQLSIIILALLLATNTSIIAQTKPVPKKPAATVSNVLVNNSIIEFQKIGLSDDIIISKISSSETKFDLSTDGLISLKKAGIGNDVIKAMMDKTNPKSEAKPVTKSKSETASFTSLNQPYYFESASNSYKPLEKNIAEIKTKMKGLGYGGSETNYEINGEKSNISLSKNDKHHFVVNTGEGQTLILALYKTSILKGKRLALFSSAKVFGKNNSSDFVVPFNTSVLQPGIVKIEFSQPLEVGEYVFIGKTSTGLTYEAFSFSIN